MYINTDIFLLTFVILCLCRKDIETGGVVRDTYAAQPVSHNKIFGDKLLGFTEDTRLSGHEKTILKAEVLDLKNGAEPFKKWKMGTVPYYIDQQSYDEIITRRIHMSMKNIQRASCVVFRNIKSKAAGATYGTGWLHITNSNNERECVHSIRVGDTGETVLTLGFECIQKRDVTHALLHVLGFKDEVTHPQRDSFVRVLWENIQPKYHHLFAIQNDPTPYHTLVEYDTMSIMHFHDRAFSSNGGATMTPLISGLIISPSDGLSQLDKMKLRLAFGHECNKRKVDNLFETCKSSLLDNKKASDEESDDGSDVASADVKEPAGNSTESKGDNKDDEDEGAKVSEDEEADNSDHDDIIVLHESREIKTKPRDSKVELKGSRFSKTGRHRYKGRT